MFCTSTPLDLGSVKPLLRIYRPRLGFRQLVRAVSRHSLFLATHWTTHSVICPGDECPLCQYQSRRVCGWLVIALPDLQVYRLLELAGQSLANWLALKPANEFDVGQRTYVVYKKALRSPMFFEEAAELPWSEENPGSRRHNLTKTGFLASCVARLYHLPEPAEDDDLDMVQELWCGPIKETAEREARKA